jgi:hypothetical protein
MRGFTFHPLFCMVLISGSYLTCFCSRAWSGNLSWQYVNSMNWTMCVGEGVLVFGFDLGLLLYIGCQVLVLLDIGMLWVCMCI